MTRILVVSHSSVVGLYQGKLHAMAQEPSTTIALVVPPQWREGGALVAAETGRYASITAASLPVRFGGIASLHFYSPFALRRFIRSFAPDVLYVEEEPWSVVTLQLLAFGRRGRMRFVFFTWENLHRSYNFISRRVLALVLGRADGAVAGNPEAAEILRRRGFDRPVIVLPQYGIDAEVFRRQEGAPPELAELRRPLVAFVGRLVPEKNIDLLVEAAARMRGDATFLIVGQGPEKSRLAAQVRRLGLEDAVKFIDSIAYDAVPRYLSAMDVLVLPSKTTTEWKEQFGRILVEAMACGVAVLGSDSGAIPWVIGDAGRVFKEGDLESLVGELRSLLGGDALRRSLGEAGVARVREQFTNAVIGRRLLEFLASVGTKP